MISAFFRYSPRRLTLQLALRSVILGPAILALGCGPLSAQMPAQNTITDHIRKNSARADRAQTQGLDYIRLARLYLAAPVVLSGQVIKDRKLSPNHLATENGGPPLHHLRLAVTRVIKAPSPIAPKINYLWQEPEQAYPARKSKFKMKRKRVILFLQPAKTFHDLRSQRSYQLIARNGQIPWSWTAVDLLKKIADEAATPEFRNFAIDTVTDIAPILAFDEEPAQTELTILAREGPRKRLKWNQRKKRVITLRLIHPDRDLGISNYSLVQAKGDYLGKVFQDTVRVEPESLIWYHLSCGLPQVPPPESLHPNDQVSEQQLRDDYDRIRRLLGNCD